MTKRPTHHNPTSRNRRRVQRALSGTVRAALLGVSDGLVTNLALILGVAASSSVVRLVGIASLIAGACSMSVGEYISMRGQVELLSSVLDLERQELADDPDTVRKALEDVFVGDGIPRATARIASTEVARDPERALSLHVRGSLGLNPNELGRAGSSAASSFVMFSLGALVPLLPWFYLGGAVAIIWSVALSVAGALVLGAYLGYTTNGRTFRSALRQLLALCLAAGATYLIGRLFHTTVG